MENIFNFLKETGKLKKMPRRGWVINQINNPESIAEHIFRATVMGWILGEKKGELNIENLLKCAVAHDLCEVYAGDTTPYDSVLPDDKESLRKLMRTWPRFSQEEKQKNSLEKHKKEKESLRMLIANLPSDFKREIMNLWMDYERRINPEGRFFNQADRMENFLQAYEYWEYYKTPPLEPWWLWAREFFDEPLLVEFMDVLEVRFHKKDVPQKMRDYFETLNFFNAIGGLKRKPRRGWVVHGIEDAETTADHIYHLTLLVWALGRNKKELNLEKLIKIALIHDMCEVYAPDFTSYDAAGLLDDEEITEEEIKNIKPLIKRPTEKQRGKMKKIKKMMEDRGVKKLLEKMDKDFQREIYGLWEEYSEERTPEGVFVREANRAINLFQGMEYYKEYKKDSYDFWLKRARETIKDTDLLRLLEEIEKNLEK